MVIIGAGTIGPDIGYYLKTALPDLTLHLVDVVQAPLDRADRAVQEPMRKKAWSAASCSAEEAEQVMQNLHVTLDYAVGPRCRLGDRGGDRSARAQAPESSRGSRQIVPPEAMITSNTSSLPAERIFADLRHKERATVTHFFAPAWRNPIVEVIRWPGADARLLDDLNWIFCMTGKVPLVTADVPCFMLDRIFDNWCNDAALLLDRASAAEIDTVATEFVHAGPFFVLNLANGNPIIIETNTLQAEAEGEHYRPAHIFHSVQTWRTAGSGQAGRGRVRGQARASAIAMLGILISQTADVLDRKIGEPADLEPRLPPCARISNAARSRSCASSGMSRSSRIVERSRHERPGLPQPRRPLAGLSEFLPLCAER